MNRFHALSIVLAVIGLGLFAGYTALYLALAGITGFWSAAFFGLGAAYIGSSLIPVVTDAWLTGNLVRDLGDLEAALVAAFESREQ